MVDRSGGGKYDGSFVEDGMVGDKAPFWLEVVTDMEEVAVVLPSAFTTSTLVHKTVRLADQLTFRFRVCNGAWSTDHGASRSIIEC